MQVGSRTEIGHVRTRNEDALLVEPSAGVFVVADGMGGHPAGDVASAVAVGRLREVLVGVDGAASAASVAAALNAAHDAVLSDSEGDSARRGMGTTAVVAVVSDDTVWVGHVGDSRCYLLPGGGELQPVTADHGAGGYLTQALGLERGVSPEVAEVPLTAGDRLLLCTDGLTNMVDDGQIATILRTSDDAQAACDALTDAALAAGGVDNVTTVVVGR